MPTRPVVVRAASHPPRRLPDRAALSFTGLLRQTRVGPFTPPGTCSASWRTKSQLQALRRRHPGLPPGPGRPRRVEFEYTRGGTLAYLAAYDVHHARVIRLIAPKTGIQPFTHLVEQVMTTEPYASARRVFWVVDNGSSHHGWRSVMRMEQAWPTTTLVHLPVHASWLNQIEIYFSILQRKAITPTDFTDLDHLAQRILAFQDLQHHR